MAESPHLTRPRRPGYNRARADEFIEAGDDVLVVGIYWVSEDGSRAEPLVFQKVTLRGGPIAHIQDYRQKQQALKAVRAV